MYLRDAAASAFGLGSSGFSFEASSRVIDGHGARPVRQSLRRRASASPLAEARPCSRAHASARVLLSIISMTHDDAHTSHNHGFELPKAPEVVVRSDPRPWRAVAGVAVCLGLAGIVTGLIVARRQSASDEHLTSDALQREELRDGWRALGVVAAHEAQQRESLANRAEMPANAGTAVPPLPNVVVVNVPTPAASALPVVNNINAPNAAAPANSVPANSVPTSSTATPSDNWNYSSGYAPNQSVPEANYSPVQGYIPVPSNYPTPPNAPQSNTPQNSYGTTGGGVAPGVGNGSIPGSSPNPALNGGLVGSTPTTGSTPTPGSTPSTGNPNSGVTPSTPVGGTPASPNTPTLPSGFSAP